MDAILTSLNTFANEHAWLGLAITILLAAHTVMKAIRDAIDKTPETDDNLFERIVSISGKVAGYLAGFRAKKNP